MADWIKRIAAAIGGIAAYLWGAWDALIAALVIAVVLDYVTGVINAGMKGELCSSVGFRGLLKKVCIFLVVALGVVVDRVIPATNGAVRTAVIMFYMANEGLSILENIGEMGVPIPEALRKMLAKMHKDSEQEPDREISE